MSRKKYREKQAAKKAAKKQVPRLFDKATAKDNQARANRTLRRARRLAMKFRMSLSPYKHLYCKHCYARLIPGRNSRVRIHGSKVITYCDACRKFKRVPVGKQTRKQARKKSAGKV